MPRGGKRTPPARTPPGGPGQLSRRTDGQQIATPPLSGSPDIQSGDIGKLRQAQRMMPLPAGVPEPRPASAMRRPAGTRTRGGATENGAGHLFTMPDENPGEPTTNGLPVGPGAGPEALDASTPSPDIRQMVLQAMWIKLGNEEAGQMLQELIANKEAQTVQAAVPPSGPPPPVAPEGEEPTQTDLEVGETVPTGPSSVR